MDTNGITKKMRSDLVADFQLGEDINSLPFAIVLEGDHIELAKLAAVDFSKVSIRKIDPLMPEEQGEQTWCETHVAPDGSIAVCFEETTDMEPVEMHCLLN